MVAPDQPSLPPILGCKRWDAMEGSVSGNGCLPTIGAMMWSEALAIADVAAALGNATLAASFETRAERVRGWYLEHLWSDEAEFLAVYKEASVMGRRRRRRR